MASRTLSGGVAGSADLLAQYELLEEIGAGARARVYRARDRVLDQVVAVKVLREEVGGATELGTLLYLAARAAASLHHPHIAEVYDQGPHERTAFLTREYLEGPDLATLLSREGPLPARRAVALILPLLDALAVAHQRGIVHGDLHPGNVVLRAEGGSAVLTDFGMALAPGTGDGARSPFLAPESEIGPAADIYSIGAILHLLLTGQAPAPGVAEKRIAGVSRGLDRAVRQALAADPGARPPTATALREALAAATGVSLAVVWPTDWQGTLGTAVRVAPPVVDRRAQRRRRARQAATLLLASSLAVGSVAGLASVAQRSGSGGARQEAPPSAVPEGEPVEPTPAPPSEEPTAPVAEEPVAQASAAPPTAPPPTVVRTVAMATATSSPGIGLAQAPTPTAPQVAAGLATPTGDGSTSTPEGATGGAVGTTVRAFSPLQLAGAFQRFDGQWSDRPSVALYGLGSGYNEGTLTFTLDAPPGGQLTLVIAGLDDESAAQCTVEITLNGGMIFGGTTGFPDAPATDDAPATWGRLRISVPAGLLHVGTNQLTLRNTSSGQRIGLPYVLIGDLALVLEE